jgi:flagellar basal body-associated protein FliL
MAEQEKQAEQPPPKGGKKKLMLVGGGVGLLGFAYLAAMMAMPAASEVRRFAGPFVVPLFDEKFHTNLDEEDHTRFLQMNMNLVFVAYEEQYVATRRADPLYKSYMLDAILRVSFTKRIDQVLGDQVALGVYLEEIRAAVDPILFPVHVGEGEKATALDPDSGLGPGLSLEDSTFRGSFD